MRRSLLLIALACLLGRSVASAPDAALYVNGLTCADGPFALQLPRDLRALKQMAPLEGEDLLEVDSWSEGHTTTRKALHFDGLTLAVIAFSNDPARYLVYAAVLSDPRWNALTPIHPGRPLSEVMALMGDTRPVDPSRPLVYTGDADTLRIESVAGRVSQVVYDCYDG